jgi:hypothetical protein
VYRADAEIDETWDMYSVPIDGGTPLWLNVVGDGDVADDYQISADGSQVVYRIDADATADERWELYSVPIDGGTPVQLNGTLPGDVSVAEGFAIDPGSARIVYRADANVSSYKTWELYSVPIGGGTAVKLNGALVEDGDVTDMAVTLDGARVVYLADQETDGMVELYRVPVGGGTAVKLNDTLPGGGTIDGFQLSPWGGGGDLVYRGMQDEPGVWELYRVPITGGEAIKVSGALVANGDVQDWSLCADGSHLAYRADQDTNDVIELYGVALYGEQAVVKLNGTLIAGGDVQTFQLTPNGDHAVYRADQDTDGMIELYASTGFAERWIYLPLVFRSD